MSTPAVHPVDERLPTGRLTALGLQHVLVMYAGAVAVPLIVGRALKLSPEQVTMLIQADLFCCGVVTLIQALGATQWFGIRLPVMMGVTFASVAPMVAMANTNPGVAGAGLIFGAIIGAGVISILLAPVVSRMLRFFPPVVTGTIIAVIGISLMRVGINWIFGVPVGPTAPQIVDPAHAEWLAQVKSLAGAAVAPAGAASAPAAVPAVPAGLALVGTVPNPKYAQLSHIAIAGVSLIVGGIGIMNIMLVSVTERTREIGLRLAVGARRRDVLNQFLAEALLVSVTGGLLGIGLGFAASAALAREFQWPILTPTYAVVGAFLFSAAVGIFFGFYPARRASRLNPIAALRYE